MLELSGGWLDPKRDRPMLEARPATKALLPKLAKVHKAVVDTHSLAPGAANAGALGKLRVEEAETDRLHDRKVRGVYEVLSGLADLSDDADEAARFIDLRERLVPAGLAAIQRSYVDEAGDAKLLPGRLDAGAKKLLHSLSLPTGKLADEVKCWTDAAAKLGADEATKAKLEAENATVSRSDQLAARNAWVRTVNLLVATLESEDDADGPELTALLAPLRKKEAEAMRPRGGAKGPVVVSEAPANQA